MIMKQATRTAIFKWRQTAPELILCAVRWYLRYSLSLRDVEELLAERGLAADHTTIWRGCNDTVPDWNSGCAVISNRPTNPGGLTRPNSSAGPFILPLPGHRFHRCHYRLPALGAARCRGGRTPVPQ